MNTSEQNGKEVAVTNFTSQSRDLPGTTELQNASQDNGDPCQDYKSLKALDTAM
jgi:hypothetical protein